MAADTIYRTEKSREILLEFYDEMIARWDFPYGKEIIHTQFGATGVVTAGAKDKPALVLLHGSASNVLGWGGMIPRYLEQFRVIAPDIPGEAGRSDPRRPSWDNDEYCLWLDELLAALGVGCASFLGLSFGGWIAARYAATRPDKTARLALLAPGGIAQARLSAILRTVLYSMQKEKGAEKLKRMIFGKGDILPEVGRFFDLLQAHFVPRFGSPKLIADEELRRIACPVLMACGTEDCFFDAGKAAARLGKLLLGAEILIDAEGQHGITEYGGRLFTFLCGD